MEELSPTNVCYCHQNVTVLAAPATRVEPAPGFALFPCFRSNSGCLFLEAFVFLEKLLIDY